jgi:ribosomal protein L25 (general stress protein Ctc)
LYLNRSVLNQNKDVIYAELRKPHEGMIALKQQGKCPAVIEKLNGKLEDEVDIVLDGKRMRKLSKNSIFPVTPLYVRVEGKEYRCVFYKIDFHPDGFIQKAYLKEYVPG